MIHRPSQITLIFVFALARWLGADPVAGQQESATTLFDPQAIAVARLDLAQIDPDALANVIESQLAKARPQAFAQEFWTGSARNLAERLRRLKRLQVAEVYVVLTLHGLDAQLSRLATEPQKFIYAVVPLRDPGQKEDVAKILVEDSSEAGQIRKSKSAAGTPLISPASSTAAESSWFSLRFDHATFRDDLAQRAVVLAGDQALLDHLMNSKRDERPSVAAALLAAGDGPVQLIVTPPPVFPRAAREILGPVILDGLSVGETFADGFQWAAVGVSEEEGLPAARVVIQSQRPEGAKQMERLIQLGLNSLAKQPEAQNWRLDELASLVDFEISGDQLRWTIDKDHTPPAKVAEPLRSVLLGQQERLAQQISIDNLRAIGLALLNFHDGKRAFPTPATYDKDGKPLLSWRVHVLAYVPGRAEQQLHQEFHLDEPWDSPHNKKLIERMPNVYRRPFSDVQSTKTPYQVPIGEQTAFRPGKKMQLRDIKDGVSKTIGIVEVAAEHDVVWTKPDDWEVDWDDPTKSLASKPGQPFLACFLDGRVRVLLGSIDKEVLRRLLRADDGLPVRIPDTSE